MMPVSDELDWDLLSADWRAMTGRDAGPSERDAVPAAVRRAVRGQGIRLKLLTAGEIAITLFLCWLTLSALVRTPSGLTVAWAAATAVLLAWTWRFAIHNRRGVWAPFAETTEAFIALSMERCRRSLATVGFTRLLVAVESGLLVPWVVWSARHDAVWQSAEHRLPLIALCVAVALYFLGVLVWSEWYRRRKVRELTELGRLRGVTERVA
jgi:hypothetical protein